MSDWDPLYGDISLTSSDMDSTVTISDYVADVIDVSSLDIVNGNIDWSNISISTYDIKRTDIRDKGKIPVDIWAKMYNNGVMEIDDDLSISV